MPMAEAGAGGGVGGPGEVAVAAHADIRDAHQPAQVDKQAEAQVRATIAECVALARPDRATLMLPTTAHVTAESAACREAVRTLMNSTAPEAEARRAADTCLNGRHPSLAVAQAEADQAAAYARDRAAHELLSTRLAELRSLTTRPSKAPVTALEDRCPGLDGTPCGGGRSLAVCV
ncbi:hypothetical protein IF129_25315 [Streptomyces chumphonensis]|uniref:Uncharacterized protein n=1 Tax=Streptomyces chumphonensis TaxID=1214925 RepID=A0A927F419_9ACTN|nr:hypothetical protein [Streptomyces chumphonensis]MBD3934868.1 hypothetical protein [Streptomyces chumphonensis]